MTPEFAQVLFILASKFFSGGQVLNSEVALTHAGFRHLKRFAGLDGIRAIAILAVIWHHAPTEDFMPIMARGFLGVDLFFVLSGFLIVTLILREKANTGKISLLDFWMRRFLRLFPAYYGMLGALLIAYVVFKPNDPDTKVFLEGLPVYALYLSNWIQPGATNLSITWSLATEEQFYVIWPLIEAFIAPIAALWVWVGALIVNQLINFGVLDGVIEGTFGISSRDHPSIMQATFTPILLGVGLAHGLHHGRLFEWMRKICGFRHASLFYAVIAFAIFSIPTSDVSGAIRFLGHIAMTLWLSSIVLTPNHPMTRVLEFKPFAYIGIVSYGMYLYHLWGMQAANMIAETLGMDSAVVFPLTVAITLAVSAASYHFFEKHFLNMRKRFRRM